MTNSLSIKILSMGAISRYRQSLFSSPPYKYKISGNVFNSSGELVLEGVRQSFSGDHVYHNSSETCPKSNIDNMPLVKGRALYAGHFFDHYGHFITEGLGRLYLLKDTANFRKIIFHPFIFGNPPSSKSLKDYQRFIFSCLGIPLRKLEFLNVASRFEELWVPEQAWPINQEAHPVMRRIYSKIRRNIPTTPSRSIDLNSREKIFIARRSNVRSTRNASIEKLFQDHGFRIIEAQYLNFADQAKYYKNAKILAGFCGSGLHNVIFCRPDAILIEIGDNRSKSRGLRMQAAANLIHRNVSFFVNGDESMSEIKRLLKNI